MFEGMSVLEAIKSRDNKLIKHCKKLAVKKYREENRQFMIEGVRFVEEALMADIHIVYCLYSKTLSGHRVEVLLKSLNDRKIDVYTIEDGLMENICETSTPQGIVAVVEKKDCNMSEIINNSSFIIAIDRIQDPGNLGTIIRTAHAAGADGIILSEGTVDLFSPKVLRSTMGSIFHIPVVCNSDIVEDLDKLKNEGFCIYAASLNSSAPYYQEDYRNKTVIVIGNEANGIDSSIMIHTDRLIKIPMPGKAESLNVAVAAGILMFEIVKHRRDIDK